MLKVFALRENVRPTAETLLCRAPYHNLYADARMCAGNAKLPEVALPADVPVWERAFFDTTFTHANWTGKVTRLEGGHNALWQQMTTATEFNGKLLIDADVTLEGLVNQA